MKKRFISLLKLMYNSTYGFLRPLLGLQDVCIYPVTCGDYARAMLFQKPWYISIPLIIFRLLSCNPIVGIIRRFKGR